MQKFLFLSILFFAFACNETTEEKIPDYVIPMEKMATVLVDVHLLEASLNVGLGANAINPSFLGKPNIEQVNEDVLKKHGVDKHLFDTSFVYYSRHPEVLNEIYQTVLNELSKKQSEILNQ